MKNTTYPPLEEGDPSDQNRVGSLPEDTETIYDSSHTKENSRDNNWETLTRLARLYAGDRSGEVVAVIPVGEGKLASIRDGKIRIQ